LQHVLVCSKFGNNNGRNTQRPMCFAARLGRNSSAIYLKEHVSKKSCKEKLTMHWVPFIPLPPGPSPIPPSVKPFKKKSNESETEKIWKILKTVPIIIDQDRQCTRVGTLIVATIYLQLIQNTYMFRSSTVLQCSHQHCVQPVASDVEVVGYL